jgi:hypothetical protein
MYYNFAELPQNDTNMRESIVVTEPAWYFFPRNEFSKNYSPQRVCVLQKS